VELRCAVRRQIQSRAGFTLIELLMVIAIVVALAGLSYGAIKGATERVALRRAKSELAVLALALEEYRQRYGDFPQTGGFEQAPLDSAQALPAESAQVKFSTRSPAFMARRVSSRQIA